ncbi:hypothetical protein JNJ66_00695 [Candidatus Saccharibacteria bacterium]|nr:hypothetical protein [Candidatus Saccharibacteria bacterium]
MFRREGDSVSAPTHIRRIGPREQRQRELEDLHRAYAACAENVLQRVAAWIRAQDKPAMLVQCPSPQDWRAASRNHGRHPAPPGRRVLLPMPEAARTAAYFLWPVNHHTMTPEGALKAVFEQAKRRVVRVGFPARAAG